MHCFRDVSGLLVHRWLLPNLACACCLLCSVKETDWRAEIQSFGKAVHEEGAEAQAAVQKGLHNLEPMLDPRPAAQPARPGRASRRAGHRLEGLGDSFHAAGVGESAAQVHARFNQVSFYSSATFSHLAVFHKRWCPSCMRLKVSC